MEVRRENAEELVEPQHCEDDNTEGSQLKNLCETLKAGFCS